jgi:hypothetical protein
LCERSLIAFDNGVFQVLPLPQHLEMARSAPAPPSRGGDFQTLTTLPKSPAGFAHLLEKLRGVSTDPKTFKSGIETPHNLLVDYLVDGEYAVFVRFPGTMKSLHKRHRPSAARLTPEQLAAFFKEHHLRNGKNFHVVYFRRACNKFYRDTRHNLAFSSLKEARWARAYYQQPRRAGHKHNHALRCLANVHLRILFARWQTGSCYDENLFLAHRGCG